MQDLRELRMLHFASSHLPQDSKVTNHMELNIIFGIRHSTAFVYFLFQRRRRFRLKEPGYLWVLGGSNYFKLFGCYLRFFEKKKSKWFGKMSYDSMNWLHYKRLRNNETCGGILTDALSKITPAVYRKEGKKKQNKKQNQDWNTIPIFVEEESVINLVPTALFPRFRAGREKSPY